MARPLRAAYGRQILFQTKLSTPPLATMFSNNYLIYARLNAGLYREGTIPVTQTGSKRWHAWNMRLDPMRFDYLASFNNEQGTLFPD